jgi:transketolase
MAKAQRLVWGEEMVELAETDARLVVLDGDLATSTRADLLAAARPDRFIQIGIAEQNMVGMAFGMSTLGYRPWLSSFGVFLTQRALDQVRMLVSQTNAPIRLAAAYTGLLNGSSGKTHQDIADLAIMRAMPKMTVLAPCDEHEARAMIRWAAEHDGPVYLRLARDAVESVFDDGYEFVPGAPRLVQNGTDVTVISTGVQTSRTREAVSMLATDGIVARLIHIPTIKPLDEAALLALIGDHRLVVTVEEHSVIGGLGGLVTEVVSARPNPARVVRIGLADAWSESAPNDFLLDKYGLSAARVARQIKEVLEA